ncbi:MAG: hypothetical protein AAF570_12875 [Bacteroidota bacterium]
MRNLLFLSIIFLFWGCEQPPKQDPAPSPPANEVLVLGAIHGGHRTSEVYGTEVLEALIRAVAPDVVLTEIPPDRYPEAAKQFAETDSIMEPRVRLFPEYVDVLFPLQKSMGFEIVPTAGWTQKMADTRRNKLRKISQDTARQAEWARYLAGEVAADSAIEALGGRDDPYVIHSPAYDAAVELWAVPYNEMFNAELGPGGWDNINAAHYGHIAKALDAATGQGKRFLIIYGAYHKGWILRKLAQRKDVKLLEMKFFLDQISKTSEK